MIINRDSYLNQLIDAKKNGMIKVITGLRRSGKSYLLFEIFSNYLLSNGVDSNHIIKFAFDSQDYLDKIDEDLIEMNIRNRKVDPKKFNEYLKSKITDDGMYYILLDEIQLLGSFEAVLNGYLRRNNVDIYVTGSNAKFLSKDVITEFRGRGWQIHINPLSFSEFKSAFNGSIEEAYNEYIVYGGLPKILEFKSDADKANYLTSIFEETYLKDIIDRNSVINTEELGELLNFIASSIGSLTNPTKLSNTFDSIKHVKLHHATISKYIEYFADSFIISTPKRYNINGKAYINTPLKYYFSDMGLRNSRLNFRELELPRLMENVVYNELIKRRYNVDVGVVEIYEPNTKGKSVLKKTEVDFVCNKLDTRLYIQVAYTLEGDDKLKQEQKSLLKVSDAFKKIIIVKDAIKAHYNKDGVYIIGLFEFLLNDNSLN